VGGISTKVIWLLAIVFLTSLPVLSLMMWATRRRRGTTGFPKRVDAIQPLWLRFIVVSTGVLLPTVGISMLAVLAFDCAGKRIGIRR
ncbi:MAG: hypothetical protein AAGA03_17620, partial [Planctomycetota bacterium]